MQLAGLDIIGGPSKLPMTYLPAPCGGTCMYIRLILTLLVLLFGTGLAFAQDEDFDRQELFEAVRLTTPGETLTSLPAKFEFPDHARAGSIFGIDVSHHNFDGCKCTFDWADIASHKVQFVYVKATQGTSYAAPPFARSVAGARDEGKLAVGAYHFLSTADGGEQEVRQASVALHQRSLVERPRRQGRAALVARPAGDLGCGLLEERACDRSAAHART